ncbi:hypothetical protein EV175_002450 [Coemansia sp. RSA 1933]|nr:hypothetical protein EV175_002450 [Coemansia sp. RSA 1933]
MARSFNPRINYVIVFPGPPLASKTETAAEKDYSELHLYVTLEPKTMEALLADESWTTLCTLISSDGDSQEDVCWGVAYKVASGMEAQVKAHLDYCEKDGYSIDFVNVFGADGQVAQRNVMVYVGVCTNPSFTRAPALDHTAAVIARAAGPSGSNREYLYKLCDALRALHPLALDPYLCRLEAMV